MSRLEILKLYKTMLRESSKIPSYSFRKYAFRRIRDDFKQNKTIPETQTQVMIQEAQNNLELIKRQAIIGKLYSVDKLIIEHHLQQ